MAKGSGYFEHDAKVGYTEGLINKASDWQWFIDYIEARFEAPREISAVGEFDGAFSSVRWPYIYLGGIVDAIGDFDSLAEETLRLRASEMWVATARRA